MNVCMVNISFLIGFNDLKGTQLALLPTAYTTWLPGKHVTVPSGRLGLKCSHAWPRMDVHCVQPTRRKLSENVEIFRRFSLRSEEKQTVVAYKNCRNMFSTCRRSEDENTKNTPNILYFLEHPILLLAILYCAIYWKEHEEKCLNVAWDRCF